MVMLTFKRSWHRDRDRLDYGRFSSILWDVNQSPHVSSSVIAELELPGVFGEGVFQLPNSSHFLMSTWQDELLLHFSVGCDGSKPVITRLQDEAFPVVGWGFATNDATDEIYGTDGSDSLYVWDLKEVQGAIRSPKKRSLGNVFRSYSTRKLTCQGRPLMALNELEIHPIRKTIIGMLYGNKHMMVEVDPKIGRCTNIFDLSSLGIPQPFGMSHYERMNAVLNGVSILRPSSEVTEDVFLVTGKLWSSMFILQFRPAE
eukprot:GHVH01008899.1.p1 GENE.GHVH01008899.1~~GHVH01008899.1.p1  ORF type:complete len:258 (+),score=32.51 GHVH01008899.1:582-1355(+)